MSKSAQEQQPPLQQEERPPNHEIIRQARELIIHLHGEKGYTLGDDGFVIKKRFFKQILNVKDDDKPALISEIYRRHDCCAERNIKAARERPKRNLKYDSVKKLQVELKVVVPSAICATAADQDELNRKKRQMDAIRSVEKQSRWGVSFGDACTGVWRALQDPDGVLGHHNDVEVDAVTPAPPVDPASAATGTAPVQAGLVHKRADALQQQHNNESNRTVNNYNDSQQPIPDVPMAVKVVGIRGIGTSGMGCWESL